MCREQALSQDQVVAAIYETIIRPEQCDRFSSSPEFEGREEKGWPEGRIRPAPVLQAHFARAVEIQEQQWNRDGRPNPGSCSGDSSRFWLLVGAGQGAGLNA